LNLDKAMERFAWLSYRRPWRVLAWVVAVTLVAGLLASRLVFHGSFVELLPAHTLEVRDLESVSQKAGGDGYLVLRARGASPETLRRFAHALAPKLEALEEVRYVEFRYDVQFFKDRALLLLPAEQLRGLREDLEGILRAEKLRANPLVVQLEDAPPPPTLEEIARRHAPRMALSEYLTSADGTELYLFVKPTGLAGDLVFAQRLVSRVQDTSAGVARGFPGVVTDATGAHVLRLEEDRRMRQDLTRSSLLSGIIAVLIVVVSCRRITSLLVVMAPVGVGLLITFALAQQTIGYLNIITGFLVAILIGLGIEYGLHLAMRYAEERRRYPAGEALRETVLGTWKGALTSACTNAAAFAALTLAEFQAFAQFGWIAAAGVMLTVLATYLIGPALIALTERLRPARAEAPLPTEPRATPRRLPRGVLVGIVVGVGALMAYSSSVMGRIGFEPDMRKLRGEFAATKLDERIISQLGRRHSPTVFLTRDVAQAGQLAATLREMEAKHGEERTFAEVVSLNDFLPRTGSEVEAERAALRAFVDRLPESARSSERLRPALRQLQAMLDAKPYGVEALPAEVRRRFTALDGEGTFVLAFKRESLSDTDALHRFGDQMGELREVARAKGLSFQVLDSNLIAYRIFELVKADGPWLLLAAGLAVFAMMAVSLRSLRKAGLVAGPLYIGLACLPAAMYLYGLKLNFINAVVLPNLLAIAVDNAVHLYHRYQEEGPGSLPHVVRTTGVAAVVATLSNAAGYGALLTASHPGLRSIGELALLGVACATLGTTVLFPAILALLEKPGPGAGEEDEDVLPLPSFDVEPEEEPRRSA
jgi:uncharacterized protein